MVSIHIYIVYMYIHTIYIYTMYILCIYTIYIYYIYIYVHTIYIYYIYYIWTGLQPHPCRGHGSSPGHGLLFSPPPVEMGKVSWSSSIFVRMYVCMHECMYVLATTRHLSATLIDLLLYLHRHLMLRYRMLHAGLRLGDHTIGG